MSALESILNMLVNVAMQIIVAFARIIDSLSESEAGKQMGLDGGHYPGKPTAPTELTIEALQAAGVDTALKFIIPAILIYVFIFRARGVRLPKGGK